jgi:ABC-type transport system substrate-binding protein
VSRSAAVLLLLAVLAVAVLTACGSDDSGGPSPSDKAAATTAEPTTSAPATTAEPTTSAPATSAEPTTPAPATSTAARKSVSNATVAALCHVTFDATLTRLRKIQDAIDGNPKFETYAAAVGGMKDYQPLDDEFPPIPGARCARTVAPGAILAWVKYSVATQSWAVCRKQQRCAAVMPDLKKRWEAASADIKNADKGFRLIAAG